MYLPPTHTHTHTASRVRHRVIFLKRVQSVLNFLLDWFLVFSLGIPPSTKWSNRSGCIWFSLETRDTGIGSLGQETWWDNDFPLIPNWKIFYSTCNDTFSESNLVTGLDRRQICRRVLTGQGLIVFGHISFCTCYS